MEKSERELAKEIITDSLKLKDEQKREQSIHGVIEYYRGDKCFFDYAGKADFAKTLVDDYPLIKNAFWSDNERSESELLRILK